MKSIGIGTHLAFGLILTLAGGALAGLSTSHLGSDAELSAILPSPAFASEGRIGDRGGASTFELGLGASTASPAMIGQFAWESGESEDFELAYHRETGVVTFVLGGEALSYRPTESFTEIFIRARAAKTESEVEVDDLVLDDEEVDDEVQASGGGHGLDILRIRGVSLDDGFLLTGKVSLTWDTPTPNHSQLAFEIQVGAPNTVTRTSAASWGSVKKLFRK